jgi:hypothetical protein
MPRREHQPESKPASVAGPRRLTEVERKLNLSFGLFAMAFRIKRHQLAQKHPDLKPRELDALTHRCFKDS